MRTISAKHAKGREPKRRLRDDLALIRYIVSAGLNYLFVGYGVRRRFYAKQRAGEKYYLDQE